MCQSEVTRSLSNLHNDNSHMQVSVSQRPYIIETMHSYTLPIYVMLIWAAPIPADRWHCSLWP